MKRPTTLLAILIIAGTFSGCATKIALKQDFWNNRNSKVGIAIASYPEGGAHKEGAQGLLDVAINAALSLEMKRYFKKISPAAFEDIKDTFAAKIREKGMDAKPLEKALDLESFAPHKGEGKEKYFKKDLRPLAEKEGIEYLVLLTVTRFGTLRAYYGFIPLEKPSALFEVRGQMVDLKTNKLVWQANQPEKMAQAPAEGKWDQPPDYPNLTQAFGKAVENGKNYIYSEFFSEAMAQIPR